MRSLLMSVQKIVKGKYFSFIPQITFITVDML